MNNGYSAACPWCGQIVAFNLGLTDDADPEALTAKAGELCNCPEARFHRGMRETENAIQEVIGSEGLKYFEKAIPSDDVDAVRSVCASILRGNFMLATITLKCGDVVKLTRNGIAVRIRRTAKRQMEM